MAERNYDDREALFHDMMQCFDEIRARYRGVRGELLAKVREELMRFETSAGAAPPREQPKATPAAAIASPAPAPIIAPPQPAPVPANRVVSLGNAKPSCRYCGRAMNARDDGALICQNGHVRLLAG
jgi:hypothetical protein